MCGPAAWATAVCSARGHAAQQREAAATEKLSDCNRDIVVYNASGQAVRGWGGVHALVGGIEKQHHRDVPHQYINIATPIY